MQRVKKGDTVMVISGSQKGQTGEVLAVMPRENTALVQGINVKTRHQKPSMVNPSGGIVKKEAPLPLAKVMPVDPETGKATRVKIRVEADGTKVRVAKSGAKLDK
jgi:large subunit ribosomal protein L24